MKVLYLALLFLGVNFLAGCEKDPTTDVNPPPPTATCVETTTPYFKSVNFFDFRTTSPFYNQAVANFRFSQDSKSYRSSNPSLPLTCPSLSCKTDLLITNNTNRKITFDFSVSFSLNFAAWNYQGAVTINPASSVNVGTINSNCARIDLGTVLLQSSNIAYQ